jgi:hypothetical protein
MSFTGYGKRAIEDGEGVLNLAASAAHLPRALIETAAPTHKYQKALVNQHQKVYNKNRRAPAYGRLAPLLDQKDDR